MRLSVIAGIWRKELTLFFASAIGYLFLGAFLLITLFTFFWFETFFARNIADVRPLFEWMPVLLIFLTAALTMRMWSEERRTGTLEFVSTLPVSTWECVLGKFAACWILLLIALLLTLPLPFTVAAIGDLDWGPVFAGYLAALLLGAAYIAVGLFVSSRTDSQIVSLLMSSLICALLYAVGSGTIAELAGSGLREVLVAIGTGSRFESIARGVVDLRDLYYYVSLALAFLALNVFALERGRWARDGQTRRHQAWRIGTALLVVNVLTANVWLNNVNGLRFDMTEGRIYSISDATRGYLRQLQEPLLIRGYFSQKTHPLLAPLVPRLKDLLREYEIAGSGKVRVEIIDPVSDPEAENEANTKYGIRAVPFQVQDRYQASLVNSYLDVLVQYGDEYEVLGFRDLIEVKVEGETQLDVQLKNPEFDITRSIKKVLYGFQGGNSIFANVQEPVHFVGYISGDAVLPEALIELKGVLGNALDELAAEGAEKFTYEVLDPDAGDGQLAQDIGERFGFQPMAASLFDQNTFYFYLTLQQNDTVIQIGIPENLTQEGLVKQIEDGLKRFASGLLRTVAYHAPAVTPAYMQQPGTPRNNEFTNLESALTSDFDLEKVDFADGSVPGAAELVMVIDPQNFDDKQVFALDQFLMKGGTVVVATSPYSAQFAAGGLNAVPRQSGLEEWLAHHGVTLGENLVMDPQNAAFPAPVTRQVGGFSFQELLMLDYPYFVDVRGDGLNDDAPMLAGLNQMTVTWASPITVAAKEGVETMELLRSSPQSWLGSARDVTPQWDESGLSPYTAEGEQRSHLLAVSLSGVFESYFADKPSPLLEIEGEEQTDTEADASDSGEEQDVADMGTVSGVIARSAESARLLVFASNDFVADQTLQMVGSADGMLYANSVQLLANVADWALEDESLVGIRARGNFNRTLPGMEETDQAMIESINYALAVLGVVLVMLFFRARRNARSARQRRWLTEAVQAGGEAR